MTTNYTIEQIRELIACPELGDDHYGKWGSLTREQRLVIVDLLGRIRYLDRLYRAQREGKELPILDTESLKIEGEDGEN